MFEGTGNEVQTLSIGNRQGIIEEQVITRVNNATVTFSFNGVTSTTLALAAGTTALAVQNTLERIGLQTRVVSAIPMTTVCEPYIRRRAVRHMEKGRVVIFAAGTGNPFFTTDSAAALRANEIHADVLLKATQVDGVYTADPNLDPDAKLLPRLTYQQVLERDLKIMDAAAISLCRDNGIPIAIFNLTRPGNVRRVVCGEEQGSVVTR